MDNSRIRFKIGQPVVHRLHDYRGVIIHADNSYQLTDEWYDRLINSRPDYPRPDKTRPWYRVLVHGADHLAYVAEENLQPDLSGDPINHPAIDLIFSGFRNGLYIRRGIA